MKKVLSVTVCFLLLFNLSSSVLANDLHTEINSCDTYALNSYSGSYLGNVEDFQFSSTNVSFTYSQTYYSFLLDELDIDTSDGNNITGANFYSGQNGNLICNIVEYNNTYCVQVLNEAQSAYARENDINNNFTIISGTNAAAKQQSLTATLNTQNQIAKTSIASRGNQLHVYASGTSVPFLISSGSAEGWCEATYIGANNSYNVTSLQYAITYNWPSDGISLWYDYLGSVMAYSSPDWPSSALTSVNGSWLISLDDGAFLAQASVSAVVKGFPLLWTIYDVCYMDGTHQ